jgi:hypothetical protein
MTFDWNEYLGLAESLAKEGREPCDRTAVSRAYYCAFCSARNWLGEHEQRFVIPTPGESHKHVWDLFDRGPERLKKQLATVGRRLRTARNEADYENELANTAKKCEEAIASAKKVLALLAQLK